MGVDAYEPHMVFVQFPYDFRAYPHDFRAYPYQDVQVTARHGFLKVFLMRHISLGTARIFVLARHGTSTTSLATPERKRQTHRRKLRLAALHQLAPNRLPPNGQLVKNFTRANQELNFTSKTRKKNRSETRFMFESHQKVGKVSKILR